MEVLAAELLRVPTPTIDPATAPLQSTLGAVGIHALNLVVCLIRRLGAVPFKRRCIVVSVARAVGAGDSCGTVRYTSSPYRPDAAQGL